MNHVLNIVSESYCKKNVGGPTKVVCNTIKGLDLIEYPYVLNKNIENYKYNWIHDSQKALIEVAIKKIPAVVGPNLFVLPSDIPVNMPSIKHCVYLQPSDWCVNLWKELEYNDASLVSWPAGIDLELFKSLRNKVNPNQVFVYFKRRDPAILEMVKKTLIENGFEPRVVIYGNYSESEFIEILETSVFGVWITISESQGIALQEALAANCPLLVLDVKTLFEANSGLNYKFPEKLKNFKATSAPYFNNSCGIIINDLAMLDEKIKEMKSNIKKFEPYIFIKDNLSLEAMAQKLLLLFNQLEFPQKSVKKKSKTENFSLSFKGNLIYWSMVINRKINTAFGKRWVKN